MAHTPGPWALERWITKDETGWRIVGADETKLLEIMRVKWQGTLANENISDDDMALILAAPDMLAALKAALPLFHDVDYLAEQAEAAIAKAEGREP